MDSTLDGTETQVPSSKPRPPPPVAKKPKPPLTQKPILAEKPSIQSKKPALNGTDERHQKGEINITKLSTCSSESSSTSTCTTSTKPIIGTSNHVPEVPIKSTPTVARPKEPPPPLPRTPPKGSSHQKTPPPLPRQPPKGQGGAKGISQSFKSPADKPLAQKIENVHDKINGTGESNGNTSSQVGPTNSKQESPIITPPVKPKPRRKTIDTVSSLDSQKEINDKTVEISVNDEIGKSSEVTDTKTTILEREISVGNSTWFHSDLDADNIEEDESSTKDSDTLVRTKENSRDEKCAIERVTSVGKSKWFIEHERNENELFGDESDEKEAQNKVNSVPDENIAESRSLGKDGDITVQANRTPPRVQKKHATKPLPPVPTIKPPEANINDPHSAISTDNKSFSCDTHKPSKCETDFLNTKINKVEIAEQQGLKSGQPKPKPRTSISSEKSLETGPLVGPRKPAVSPKLLPKPKKRSSISKQPNSGKLSRNQNVTSTSETVTISSKDRQKNTEDANKTEECVFIKTSEPNNVTAGCSKSKVISAQNKENQYRVIDKSIIGTSNQKAEPFGNETKELPQNTDDSDANVSVVELRKKFKENKQPVAQIDVPNTDSDIHNVSDRKEDSKSSSDHTPSSLKDSFDDLLSDKSILEPSSLLTEIEEILFRSYKHSSLTRSGSSPEKRPGIALNGDDVKTERSLSLDLSPEHKTSTPIRPPRPKKEAKRLRSQSQIIYDTCASDTESLPDLSVTREEELQLLKDDLSKTFTLGPAKPHPPKPKRNKLLKVQRSHSDITKMKSFLDQKEMAENKISHQHKQGCAVSNDNVNNNTSSQSRTGRAKRPSRKAPPPPIKKTSQTSVDLNTVVPVDSRVKSMNLEKRLSQKSDLQDTAGSIYDSIKDVEVPYSSDEDHDYHEIPEHLRQKTRDGDSRSKSGSPPKLPPRNYSNSNSFDSSSQSGFVCDISLGDTASSLEDLSVSSAVLKSNTGSKGSSPLVKKRQISKTLPSPLLHRKLEEVKFLDSSGLSGSSLSIPESLPDSTGSRTRPVSNASEMTVTSSDSEEDDEETKMARKKEKKLFYIAQEVVSSERVFVDVLRLLNVDFRKHISEATEHQGRPVIPNETLNRILDYLPQLQNFNEDLLKDLEERINNWDTKRGIADIFVKKGPFLKLYTSYIRDFQNMTAMLDDAVKKHPAFQAALREFELSPRCASLALKHYMLKPIQRIPQYRLLLQDYMKHLPPDSPEMKDMQTALNIVSEVAERANENMRHGDYVQKMLEIQRSLIGQFEVIKPGRIFLKEGELMKLSRKEPQPRYFFLFNDVLLYTTPVATGYKLSNVLPLAGMKVTVSAQDDFKNEFSIVSVQRSFTLAGSTLEERDDWVSALNAAIEENAMKRNTFEAVRAGTQTLLDKDFVLGHKHPIWIPDARVTMCMLCTCEFTVTWRRHHCRACGRVVCGNCSDNKAQLRYLKYKEGRVCDECFKILSKDGKDGVDGDHNESTAGKEGEDSWLSINGLFERFGRLRLSKGADRKLTVHRPKVLTEVTANDQGATMSGYLHKLYKGRKWKKLWFVLKDKVLYQFKATQDQAAADQMVLLGYEVVRFTEFYEGTDPGLLFQLTHPNIPPIVFKTDSTTATEKWVTVMREASVA